MLATPTEMVPMVGQSLGHYRIIGELGAGGMGQVFRALDSRLQREVALKVLPTALASNPERVARFDREARLLAALDHPGIVAIHSVERVDGVHFLTMKLVDGLPLSRRLPPGGLPLERLLEWSIALADAVAAAHRQGVVHRDLKPANVMISRDGRLYVLDFGLAKLRDPGPADQDDVTRTLVTPPVSALSQPGRILGTLAYLSPEQAEGHDVDERADVFALGVMLYEMAAGRRPFAGDNPASMLAAIMRDQPAPIAEVVPHLPRELGRIIVAAMQKAPERRTQSAADLRNQLVALREELAVVPEPSRPAGRRTPALVALAAAILAAAVIGFGAGRWLPSAPARFTPQKTAPAVERITTSGKVPHAEISPDGAYLAYVEQQDALSSLRLRHLATGSDVDILTSDTEVFGRPVFSRDSAFIYYVLGRRTSTYEEPTGALYRVPLLGGVPRRIATGIVGRISLAPDDQSFVCRQFDSPSSRVATILKGDGSPGTPLAPDSLECYTPLVWSPDGQQIAFTFIPDGSDQISVGIIEPRSRALSYLPGLWGGVFDMAWQPDNRALVICGANESSAWTSSLWRQSSSGGELTRLAHDARDYVCLSITADGRTVAAIVRDMPTDIWAAPASDPDHARRITAGGIHGTGGIAVLPDGRILQARVDFQLTLLSPDARTETLIAGGNGSRYPRVSRDGSRIALSAWHDGIFGLGVLNLDGSDLRRLTDTLQADPFPCFTPDGVAIIFTKFSANEWSLHRIPVGGGPSVEIVGHPAGPADISPDGSQVAFLVSSSKGPEEFQVVDLSNASARQHIAVPDGLRRDDIEYGSIRWSSDGTALTFIARTDGIGNIWSVSLADGAPKQLTHFSEESVICYEWTADGRLVMSRGDVRHDAVVIRGLL